ncbi:hypothetical protein Pcinc_036993, partial [Petrolisthes cinctipes]
VCSSYLYPTLCSMVGYWAIIAMVGIAYICCYTGKILVDCLYEDNEEGSTGQG